MGELAGGEAAYALRDGAVSGAGLRLCDGVSSRLDSGLGAAAGFPGATRKLDALIGGRFVEAVPVRRFYPQQVVHEEIVE